MVIEVSDEEKYKLRKALVHKRVEVLDELSLWRYRVQSTLLIASVTILAINVSVGSNTPGIEGIPPCDTRCHLSVLYICLIVINALCILSLSISLVESIDTMDRANRNLLLQQQSPESNAHRRDGKLSVYLSVDRKLFFSVCEKASYILFSLLVVCLTLYALMK